MAGNVKGITIEFQGDTTKLDKALREVRNSTKDIDSELRNVDRALKFNPNSVDLWRQKQDLLRNKIKQTETNLKNLKSVQKQLDTKGVDKNSEQYRKLRREIITTESKLKNFKAQLRSIGNANLKVLGSKFQAVGKTMMTAGKTLTRYVTGPLVAIGAVSAKKFAEVDKTMTLTNETMGNTAQEADLLNKAMKEAAANSTYGMKEAATATLNFARAGLDAEQAASALAPAMALAAGEGGNLDTVSGGLVATINGFHDSFENAGKYADIFANACNNSALDVNSLSHAMSVAAPIFAAAGYEVSDAALYMGVMANNGIEADKAANSLKTGIARLIKPTDEASDWMSELGISITNSDGTMKDSVTVQKELHDAFSALSESEQIAAASAIFGKNQMSPWLALINTAPADVEKLNGELAQTGTATQMSDKMMSGYAGSLEKLKSGIDVLATSLGEALAPMIQTVAEWIQKIVDWFNNLSPQMQTTIATVGVIVAALGPLLIILGALASAIGSIITFIGTIGPAISALGGVIAALSGPIGWVIAAIAAAIAIGIALYKNWDKIKAKAIEIKNAVVKAWNDLKAKVSATVNTLKTSVLNAFNNIKARVTAIFNAVKTAITHPIQTAVALVKTAISKIKGILSGNIKLPHIKLPHFSIKGKLSLDPPSVPKLSIDWYKNGGIFNSPTIAGIGEAGAEAVIPLDKLWQKLDRIADVSGGGNVINVYGSPGMSVDDLAAAVEQRLVRQQKQRLKVWGY
jgi:TP901 family phage tail tape measure protein